MGNFKNPVVLISVLDWGLGHATRCIPIIKELKNRGYSVIIGASGAPLFLLKNEFPDLEFIIMNGYNLRYPANQRFFISRISVQLPKILLRKYQEKRQIQNFLKSRKIDLIISDNRPGVYHKSVYSVYITHQIQIKTGNKFIDKIASQIHQSVIKKFDECWVPDEEENGLSGALSHIKVEGIQQRFIGPLSRMEIHPSSIEYDYCIILSGPEPQRTILEAKILSQIHTLNGRIIFIRGLPEETQLPDVPENISITNHLPAELINKTLNTSKTIISRCGYSTVMDLVKLKKSGILIPTPGQAEQEYIGEVLSYKKYFLVKSQDEFSLSGAVKEYEENIYHPVIMNFNLFKQAIDDVVRKIPHEGN